MWLKPIHFGSFIQINAHRVNDVSRTVALAVGNSAHSKMFVLSQTGIGVRNEKCDAVTAITVVTMKARAADLIR
jgi:hypothetical protein